ncbi:L-serine ammonia-lyase, iron-sulfur-dependent, subunit alpha [Desulfovibrio sp. Huiquan2017]|uniref:L-serine ammonia-lyase, iron-sulfur-dependent, subunit alpha n=1 Tax=Desulfovibrio sp. Huiquan2017 TaxID=2816861 RepID=UPI001A930C65|nr:L-serine ammonia-lyase, iron-sulfur-dependent, subunit alpha [Desulfovibrio sp. Huiquan2017]
MSGKTIEPASIFNDVIGPVMTGPSSSHTAGPARIGKAVRLLAGEPPRRVRIVFKKGGSYPGTYNRQGSDKGFVGGLLGFDPDHERLGKSLDIAAGQGIDVSFEVEPLDHPHPNTARIHVCGASGREHVFLTLSTGGGMFEIVAMDGHAVSVTGVFHEVMIFGPNGGALDGLAALASGAGGRVVRDRDDQGCFMQLTFDRSIPETVLDEVSRLERDECCTATRMDPILPVAGKFTYTLPFTTAAEAVRHADPIWTTPADLALEYEHARSGLEPDEIISRMVDIVRTMRRAAANGLADDLPVSGYMAPKAASMARAAAGTDLADLGIMRRGMLIATAIMEYNSAGGIVVAAPTAGSCGVLPAVVLSMAETSDITEEEQARALLAAGLVGVFIAHQATFAAEVCACQAEVGAATAMAAAATVQLLGGNAQQAFDAAGLALQNVLGLVCDPVAGLVAIPCINRNSMGAANAVVSANMVLCGFDPIIPLDEVIVAMREIGGLLPSELRCTNRGGLCLTPTALRLSDSLL